jgi:uncharacterized protein (DUF983 family)
MPQSATPDPTLTDLPAPPIRWVPNRAAPTTPWNRPGTLIAMRRGFAGRCPSCGQTKLFQGWLRQTTECANCGAPLGRIRADDAPPYFVIFVVAHAVIATQLALDSTLALSPMAEAAIFLPITLAAALLLLRPVKGATIGLMLQLDMVAPAAMETPAKTSS